MINKIIKLLKKLLKIESPSKNNCCLYEDYREDN